MEEPPKKVQVIEIVQEQSINLSMKDEILSLIIKQINLIERNKQLTNKYSLHVSYYNEINRKLKILQLSPEEQAKSNLSFDDIVFNKPQYEINLEIVSKRMLETKKQICDICSEQISLNDEIFEANKRHYLFMISYLKIRNHIINRYLYPTLIVPNPPLNFVNIL